MLFAFPVVLPADLWDESGRYESVGSELLRFTDRNDARMVLGMTHEEAAVQLVREYAQSYTKYPFMIYQFQSVEFHLWSFFPKPAIPKWLLYIRAL